MKNYNTITKKFSEGGLPSGDGWVQVRITKNIPTEFPATFYGQSGEAVFDEATYCDVIPYDLVPLDLLKEKVYFKINATCGLCLAKSISFKGVDVDISTEKKIAGIVNIKPKAKKFKANKNGGWLDLTAQDVLDLQDLLDDETQRHIDDEFNKTEEVDNLTTHQALANYLLKNNGG
tara:strand:+ start:279 stop:806 length:528 start_codon:yes stop_codon:yes gene_type:complete